MRKFLVASMLFAGVLCANEASAQTAAPSVSPAMEKCLRANAATVERAVTDLAAAVDFLTQNVCADEARADQAETHRLQMQKSRAQMQKNCDRLKEQYAKQGRTAPDFCANMEALNGMEDMPWANYGDLAVSTPTKALASRLLLDLRVKRLEAK